MLVYPPGVAVIGVIDILLLLLAIVSAGHLPPRLGISVLPLTRFNKIAISNNKFQMASGQGSHWLIESPTIFSSMCSPPLSDICQFYF